MPIERSERRVSSERLRTVASRLLNASTLCAIATLSSGARPHLNPAYFAWNPEFDLFWLSAPEARHSRNLAKNSSAAVAVYDSSQTWGRPDRGIQLFGSAREAAGVLARKAELVYAKRFPRYPGKERDTYRFYRFHPRRMKLFDERALGSGTFVTANITSGRVAWVRTEVYRYEAQHLSSPPRGEGWVRGLSGLQDADAY